MSNSFFPTRGLRATESAMKVAISGLEWRTSTLSRFEEEIEGYLSGLRWVVYVPDMLFELVLAVERLFIL